MQQDPTPNCFAFAKFQNECCYCIFAVLDSQFTAQSTDCPERSDATSPAVRRETDDKLTNALT